MPHLFGRHVDDLVGGDDGSTLRTARDHGQRTVAPHRRHRRLETVEFVQRHEFVLVAEQDVDFVLDQRTEVVAVAIDAETVGQRERHLTTGPVGHLRRVSERLLRIVAIEEVALHVQHTTHRHHALVDIGRAQVRRHAEVRVHGALRVGRDDDDASTSRHTVHVLARCEVHTDRAQVVTEHLTEVVGTHFSDVRGAATETRDAAHRVGGRTTAHFDGRTKRLVQVQRTVGVDEGHRTLGESLAMDERVVGLRDHVDERVPDTDYVVTGSVRTNRSRRRVGGHGLPR